MSINRHSCARQLSSAAVISNDPSPDCWYVGSTDRSPRSCAAEFDINAGSGQTLTLSQKELSLLEQILDAFQVDAIRFNEEPLGTSKGAIDKRSDLFGVCQQRPAH